HAVIPPSDKGALVLFLEYNRVPDWISRPRVGARMRIKKGLATGLVVLLAATALGCGKRDAGGSSAASAKGAERESDQSREARFDKHAEEQIASSQAFEARKWLKTTRHVIFKHANQQVAQLVDEFYQAGASQVYVAGVEEHEGSQFGTMLI